MQPARLDGQDILVAVVGVGECNDNRSVVARVDCGKMPTVNTHDVDVLCPFVGRRMRVRAPHRHCLHRIRLGLFRLDTITVSSALRCARALAALLLFYFAESLRLASK